MHNSQDRQLWLIRLKELHESAAWIHLYETSMYEKPVVNIRLPNVQENIVKERRQKLHTPVWVRKRILEYMKIFSVLTLVAEFRMENLSQDLEKIGLPLDNYSFRYKESNVTWCANHITNTTNQLNSQHFQKEKDRYSAFYIL